MQVFLVDDEESKAHNIAEFMKERFPRHDLSIYRSFQSGLKALVTCPPTLVLLDMTMPTYDVGPRESGGRERRYAGREVIRQLRRRKIMVPVIVITQYERFEEDGREVDLATLRDELSASFPDNFVDSVYYNASDSNWMSDLERLIEPILGPEE